MWTLKYLGDFLTFQYFFAFLFSVYVLFIVAGSKKCFHICNEKLDNYYKYTTKHEPTLTFGKFIQIKEKTLILWVLRFLIISFQENLFIRLSTLNGQRSVNKTFNKLFRVSYYILRIMYISYDLTICTLYCF
jgi:hypothetical protein